MNIKASLFGLGILLIFWVLIPSIFIFINQQLNLPVVNFNPAITLLGIGLIVAGFIVSMVASNTFTRHGKGTPALIEPPEKLVEQGVYKRTRNPIYVAHVIVAIGIFLIGGHSLLALNIVLNIIGWHIYITKHEEPILQKRYGKEYTEYKKRVPRWL